MSDQSKYHLPADALAVRKNEIIKELELAKKLAAEKAALARLHAFTDSTGKHTIRAELITFKDNHAHLKKKDGKVIKIRMRLLSKDDQKWIQDELKRRRRN